MLKKGDWKIVSSGESGGNEAKDSAGPLIIWWGAVLLCNWKKCQLFVWYKLWKLDFIQIFLIRGMGVGMQIH